MSVVMSTTTTTPPPTTTATTTSTHSNNSYQTTSRLLTGLLIGATAGSLAVVFTNPWEVVKTRLQLQGELLLNSSSSSPSSSLLSHRVYNNAPHALMVIGQTEGIRGLQRGLIPAIMYQAVMNGIRLGGYEPVKRVYSSMLHDIIYPLTGPHSYSIIKQIDTKIIPIISGGSCGVLAAFIASPLFMIKTRLQSYSSDPRLQSVGTQHHYRGMIHALRSIINQAGYLGLWQGASASMMRTGVGSAVQLASYDAIKNTLSHYPIFNPNSSTTTQPILLHFTASMCTGLLVCAAMNPLDLIMTRMYNQPSNQYGGRGGGGIFYSSPIDCAIKTFQREGIKAFGKGFFAHWLRVGPHTTLTFVFLEQLRSIYHQYST